MVTCLSHRARIRGTGSIANRPLEVGPTASNAPLSNDRYAANTIYISRRATSRDIDGGLSSLTHSIKCANIARHPMMAKKPVNRSRLRLPSTRTERPVQEGTLYILKALRLPDQILVAVRNPSQFSIAVPRPLSAPLIHGPTRT